MSVPTDSPFVVAIIPARGGSSRIPRKNLVRLGGHPLVAHSILAAKHAGLIHEVFVSTDDTAIASTARRYGAEVIRRPAELSTNTAPTEPALIHAVERIEAITGRQVSIVVMLQPTSPLRRAARIDQAVELMLRSGCDSVVGVTPQIDYYFLGDIDDSGRLQLGYDPNNRLRTQDIPPRYRENGAVYAMTRKQLMQRKCRIGGDVRALIMEDVESIDIDTEFELQLCNFVMTTEGRRNHPSHSAPLLDEPWLN